jgi:branched-chain amino acid transport system ATP-binding protein
VLELRDVVASYGPIQALRRLTLRVPAGRIVALLGANGAGKTTTLRVVSGLLRPTGGAVLLHGQPIDHLDPERIVRRGVVQVPEGRQIFPELTVQENLRMGAYTRRGGPALRADMDRVLARFPVLGERRRQLAGTLSGGEQQMLAIARGLLGRPAILLLDEPSHGLAPRLVRQIFREIQSINDDGTTILLVEQDAAIALSIAHLGYVMETGRVVLEGEAPALAASDAVRRSYLGR